MLDWGADVCGCGAGVARGGSVRATGLEDDELIHDELFQCNPHDLQQNASIYVRFFLHSPRFAHPEQDGFLSVQSKIKSFDFVSDFNENQ